MTIATTVQWAFKHARDEDRSFLTALFWAVEDLRQDALYASHKAGVPALLLADLGELPGLMGQAEYVYKTQWFEFLREGAIGVLIREMNLLAESEWD
jgi:hypothetical protein